MKELARPALVLFALLSALTGIAYPALVGVLSHSFFAKQAEGSLVEYNHRLVGSLLIGQSFTDPAHFWGRPSASTPMADNPLASGGSNLGPTNPALTDVVKSRVAALRAADPGNLQPVPVDLVTASASGLDPDISIAAANYQVARVARARHMAARQVQALVVQLQHQALWGMWGEPRVNVLQLNLALDGMHP